MGSATGLRKPDASVQDIERQLTPSEMGIVRYHRDSLSNGTYGTSPEGYPVTVYSNTIQVPEGPHKGKYATVPGWFDGKMNDDERVLYNRWSKDIAAGGYPVYDDPRVADSRAKFIHGIMDREAEPTMWQRAKHGLRNFFR